MERIINKLLYLLIILSIFSCSDQTGDPLRFGVTGLTQNFDPRFATDAASERTNHLLHCSLVRFDQQRKPTPGIARWEQLTPTSYLFHIDSNVTFWNGDAVTAADVVATYASILDEKNASPHRSTLSLIESVTALDQQTVEFILNRSDALFPSYLVIGILPAHLIDSQHPFHSQPVGCGNFSLVESDQSRTIIEQRYSSRELELIRVQDPSTRVLKLLKGEIDMLQGDLSPQLVDHLAKQDGIEVIREKGSNFTYLGFNLQDPLTGELNIRRAIAHAIDRNAIIKYIFRQRARPANGLFPSEHWITDASLPQINYSPETARKFLRQAGYDNDKRLALTYKTSSDPFRIRVATIIQQQLSEVGIDLTIKSYDWGTFYGDIKAGNFQLYSLTWVGLKTPDSYRYLFHSGSLPPTGANRGRFQSAEANRLIEAAENEMEASLRLQSYHQLQHHLLEQLPYVPLWYEDQVAAVRGKASGYQVAGDGNYDGLETHPWLIQAK
ncbi:ABC transporter substrate-binding protein [Solemya velum gill symbiont]|uniref:ABC-type oligopeptide transport systems DppCBBAF, subunit A n=1 Tax=Solemya velum gill symbiont TaxID=2340 RepID=A0A0B0H7F8_SOVGS|nr:ABC transporter substrate-binding protein [Solemya velum gill symbiont]KHF24597.1 ABC-type oligopeptide transport systems DppCBBAF, subunit A [Solemya velum gill symbiont]OOY36488.1 peptide ABC transporter substrate-binding protein [Solemya velum gill symbiont]OOY41950.1 peptide ABC transporter substrate-binding protein [Solemya velum gill symbiont]OOY43226.1 peptide ABC transporter substrate-binding protein [Solemya velum gill symbiont]OOY45573.1 peptide ABC transporter substrate-binding p